MVSRSRSNTASTMAAPKPLPGEIGEPRANRIRAARQRREIDQPDLGLALARQHPHQIGIVHRIERMILQRAFVQRHGADEQIALIDGAAGFRKGRRHQHDRVAGIGAQRIHHRADIAGVGGIEGRADLEQHVIGAAAAQPFFRRARARHREARLDRAALQRHHHGIDLGQREIVRRARRWSAPCAGRCGSACWRDRRRRCSRRRCSPSDQRHGFTPA